MVEMSYMGTKRMLVSSIAAAIREASDLPLLELFAGMSSLSQELASERSILANDTQMFASTVCEFRYLPHNKVPLGFAKSREFVDAYRENVRALRESVGDQINLEANAITGCHELFAKFDTALRQKSALFSSVTEFSLFTRQYSGTYFGLAQCVEIDSIRCGIDAVVPEGEVDHAWLRRRLLVALGVAMSRCSNSTGHFAQYLTCREENAQRVKNQRRRSIYDLWLQIARKLEPSVPADTANRNEVFRKDAIELLGELGGKEQSLIVYADPPYTSDQYSRYYHLLDTMVAYDHPEIGFKGRYRSNRFVSGWSKSSEVDEQFNSMIKICSDAGFPLIISYPDNGLLPNSTERISEKLAEHYATVTVSEPITHLHSTMGASKGVQKMAVGERLFVAKP